MKWKSRRSSSNIEDRRGSRVSRKAKGGGLGAIVITLIAIYFGVDPQIASQLGSGLSDLGGSNGATQTQSVPYRGSAEENQLAQFVAVVLADTEDTWREVFKSQGSTYREPVLVLFKSVVKSACGMAESAMGPFYCPADSKIYIDLSFYNDLKQRLTPPARLATTGYRNKGRVTWCQKVLPTARRHKECGGLNRGFPRAVFGLAIPLARASA